MVALAITGNPAFTVSDIEYQQKGVSYSFKTIDIIRKSLSLNKEQLYFLVGGDSLVNFQQWKNPEYILDSATVVVAGRKNADYSTVDSSILDRVIIAETPLIEISSTGIRHAIKVGQSVRYKLPDAVIDYISEHQLYK